MRLSPTPSLRFKRSARWSTPMNSSCPPSSRAHGDGERLPTEAQLVETLQLSRPTVREALRMLGQAGMVERRRGRYGGWFVARRQSDRIADSMTALLLLSRSRFERCSRLAASRGNSRYACGAPRLAHDLTLMREAIEQSENEPRRSGSIHKRQRSVSSRPRSRVRQLAFSRS